ncbi:MAG: glycosyltransferase family 4 protein [Candidatus Dormibacteraeota bacterium]|nr:glycosyltransferase family 4 protein [Candidatus Dormibacteraeota bacterium]
MARLGVDLTACWRDRVGMVTHAVELTRAMLQIAPVGSVTIFSSRERVPGLTGDYEAVLSPHRHELANKALWLPYVEAAAGLDAILYPYWPPPPRRLPGAPPAAMFVHDLAFRLRPAEVPWQQRLYLGTVLPRALETAFAIMVPSAATREDLLDCYPMAKLGDRVEVVPEGPTPLPSGGTLPMGLRPGYVLAVGTLEARKNYGRLVAAHRSLKGTGAPLVIAGRPGWNGEAPPAGKDVHVLGHVDDATLAALYDNAALLAFPSLYEGFGLPLLDAMTRGLPAIVGNRGALAELGGHAVVCVDPEDEGAIAAALTRLLGDAGLRARLAEAGRRRAKGFSWEGAASSALQFLSAAQKGHQTIALGSAE